MGLTEKSASLAKLNEEHYKLILSPHSWRDCDIIHAVHVCLRKSNPGVEGLQRPTLGPCRIFNQVNGLSSGTLLTSWFSEPCCQHFGKPFSLLSVLYFPLNFLLSSVSNLY